ncbi:MAG: hypothetical protein AUG87_08465 [Candidatus Rokubacteria bacterium 13_1_20CM_4_70_14]|nr:MAG: hypothetical protein AUG87_08465 [Candidatus Rokubacteria bacterium 13_1_20CM_4_70_14]
MRRRIAAFTVAALLTAAPGVSAQLYAPQSLESYFRLVRMDSRAFFSASVPEAASYRVQVLSFDWTGRGGQGGGM